MKTSDLIGPALDWAVAKCEGHAPIKGQPIGFFYYGNESGWYDPSTNWAIGGPIIEREGIDLYCNMPSGIAENHEGWETSWRARYHRCGVGSEMTYGPTPLIAAMRAYVASTFGSEIEIPEELR